MTGIILILIIAFLASPLHAQDAPSLQTPAVDCEVLSKEIKSALLEPVTCFRDDECKVISWGCPWQMAPCHFSVYSASEEAKNAELSKKVSLYSKVCMMNDPDMKERCSAFYDYVSTTECKVRTELACVSGYCVTPTDIILPIDGQDAADIYGSREVIGDLD